MTMEEQNFDLIEMENETQGSTEFFDTFQPPIEDFAGESSPNNVEWNCGYVNAVYAAIDYALEYHRNLFIEEEIVHLHFLRRELSLNCRRVLCRLLFRKHKWMKTSSFIHYLKSKPHYCDEEMIQLQISLIAVLNELLQHGFIIKLSSALSFEECWEVACQLFTYDDWLTFYKFLFSISASKALNGGGTSATSGSGINSKQDFIRMMKKTIVTQKTVFGDSLSVKLPRLFLKFLETVWMKKTRTVDSLASLSNGNTSTPRSETFHAQLKDPGLALVQMRLEKLYFLKRVMRLYQITSNFPSLVTGSTLISIYRAIDNYAPLLTLFKMVSFPNYPILLETKDHQSILFRNRQQFYYWEASVEFKVLLEEVELIQQEKRIIRREEIQQMKSRVFQLITVFPSIPWFLSSSSSASFSITLVELIQLIYRYCFQASLEREDFEEILQDSSSTPSSEATKLLAAELLGLCHYFLTVTSMLCYLSILFLPTTSSAAASSEITLSDDFLRRYFPETNFTSLALLLAEIYEKQRQYPLANLIYELLLQFPFFAHRRGRWYKRLAINYDHLKLTNGLLSTLLRGLSDGNIMYSDEIDLRDRARTCQKKLQSQKLFPPSRKKATVQQQKKKEKENKKKNTPTRKRKRKEVVDLQVEEQQESDEEEEEEKEANVNSNNITSPSPSNNNSHKEGDLEEEEEEEELDYRFLQIYHRHSFPVSSSSSLNNSETTERTAVQQSFPPSLFMAMIVRRMILLLSKQETAPSSLHPLQPIPPEEKTVTISEQWHCSRCTFFNHRQVTHSSSSRTVVLSCEICAALYHPATTMTSSVANTTTTRSTKRVEVIDLIDSDCETETNDPLPSSPNVSIPPALATSTSSRLGGSSSSPHSFLEAIHFQDWTIHPQIETFFHSITSSTSSSPNKEEEEEQRAWTELSSSLLSASASSSSMEVEMTASSNKVEGEEEGRDLSHNNSNNNNLLQACLSYFSSLTTSNPSHDLQSEGGEEEGGGNPNPNPSNSKNSNRELKQFFLHGQRWGDPSQPRKKGKSIFCGLLEDQFCSVEELVLQKCQRVDPDEFLYSSAENHPEEEELERDEEEEREENQNQNQIPKKRRGKKISSSLQVLEAEADALLEEVLPIILPTNTKKTSSTLLLEMKRFQTVSYASIVQSEGGWDGWHCEGSILRSLFGLFMFPVLYSAQANMFLTPYQDAPLDFPYPSFFQRRKALIESRIAFLYHCSGVDLLQEIAWVYEGYWGSTCVCINWEAFSLLALQLSAVAIGGKTLAVLCYAMSLQFKQLSSGAPDLFLLRMKKRTGVALDWYNCPGHYEVIPLERFFGEQWKVDARRRSTSSYSNNNKNSSSNREESWMLSKAPSSQAIRRVRSEQSNYRREKMKKDDQLSIRWSSSTSKLSSISIITNNSDRKEEVIDLLEEEEEPAKEATIIIESAPEKVNPVLPSPTRKRGAALLDFMTEQEFLEEYHFEAMLIEVKGPGDHLAYKQLFWLQLFSLEEIHSFPIYVAHVKEEKPKQKSKRI